MGGGDLNLKKSWHPLTVRNQEIVWKLEQQQEEEEKKKRQYQKELKRERQIQELKKLQVETGVIPASAAKEKMEWMYASTAQRPSLYQEDFLLGKRSISELLDSTDPVRDAAAFFKKNDDVPQMPLISQSVNLLKKDMESKIREDPLFAIKKKEQEIIIKAANSHLSPTTKDFSHRSDVSEWSSRSARSISTPLRSDISIKKRNKTWSMSEEERNIRLLEMKEEAKKHQETKMVLSGRTRR